MRAEPTHIKSSRKSKSYHEFVSYFCSFESVFVRKITVASNSRKIDEFSGENIMTILVVKGLVAWLDQPVQEVVGPLEEVIVDPVMTGEFFT